MKSIFKPIYWIRSGCLVYVAILASIAGADSSVWQIQSEDHTIYIGGTVHLLRATDYPLPEEYAQAYAASAKLIFETDLNSMNDLAVQAKLMKRLRYGDSESLKTVLSDEAYSALEAYVSSISVPLGMLEKFKPGMVVSLLQVMEFQRIGFTPQGVDASMGEGNESEFILLSLKDLDDTVDVMDDMIEAWRTGDNDALSELFVADMLEQAPEIYDSLLKQRNLNWLPQLEGMLESPEVEFVLVGAAHLVGPDGLLALLQAKGFQVSRL
jgi:uncharacterized protein YbaP (TraB family)